MHDVWEPELHQRISRFMQRKSREYPDLNLSARWDKYEYMGRPRRFSKVKKLSQSAD